MKEKDSLIEQQVSEVKNLNKEISRLKEDLESQRAKNNVSNCCCSFFYRITKLFFIFTVVHVFTRCS